MAAVAAGTASAGLTQVLQWPLQARVAIAVLAPVLAVLGSEMRARGAQDDYRDRLLTGRVAVSSGPGRLPRVCEVAPDRLRVHAAQVEVPYIERDRQPDVDAALGPRRAVLAVGHSMAGKTRLVVELVRKRFADAPLLVPESGQALREMVEGGLSPKGTVVILDDLERFLGGDGMTVGVLEQLIASEAVVVATMRTDALYRYRPREQLRPAEWEVLQRFTRIDLPRRLTRSERARVRARISDPEVLAGVERYGLAEYLGAGPDAVTKFEHGETVCPVGYAIVRAAIDWRRAGFSRPLPRSVLTAVMPAYLGDVDQVPPARQVIDQGLSWATEKINETVALLHCRDDGTGSRDAIEPFDYLVDYLAAKREPIPDDMWVVAVQMAKPGEAVAVGYAAYQADRLPLAEKAWRRAADAGNADAMFALGALVNRRGDSTAAERWCRRAADAGSADAMSNLAVLLQQRGEAAEAEMWCRRGANAGSTPAMFNLAVLLERCGEIAEAETWYRCAAEWGDTDAMINLGFLLSERGETAEAETWCERAAELASADITLDRDGPAIASCRLGVHHYLKAESRILTCCYPPAKPLTGPPPLV